MCNKALEQFIIQRNGADKPRLLISISLFFAQLFLEIFSEDSEILKRYPHHPESVLH